MEQTESQVSRKHARKAGLIEASLYVTGRPLDVKTLGAVAKMRDEDKVRELVSMVARRYKESSSCLEILELQDGRFVMQLRSDFVPEVKKLATKKLLTIGPLRTLSFIAARQPITQSHVVRVRGKLAYKHIKQLQDLQLVSKSSLGRTCLLRTTENFSDYFNLSHDAKLMKKQLDRLFSELNTQQEHIEKNARAS